MIDLRLEKKENTVGRGANRIDPFCVIPSGRCAMANAAEGALAAMAKLDGGGIVIWWWAVALE